MNVSTEKDSLDISPHDFDSLLEQYLISEFPKKIIEQGKEYLLSSYLSAVKSPDFLPGFLRNIKSAETKNELRDYIKVKLDLPVGLRVILANLAWDTVRGWFRGQLHDECIKVIGCIDDDGLENHYQIYHSFWNITLGVKVGTNVSVKRFIREARIWISLGLHPNLLSAFFLRYINHEPCIFTEPIVGQSLSELIRSQKFFSGRAHTRRLFDALISLTWALEHIHSRGVAHLDIRPEQIIVDIKGDNIENGLDDCECIYKIANFSSARIVDSNPNPTAGNATVADTRGRFPSKLSPSTNKSLSLSSYSSDKTASQEAMQYLSPEQSFASKHANSAIVESFPSDVFSLALVFLEVIRGRPLTESEAADWVHSRDASRDRNIAQRLVDISFQGAPMQCVALKPLIVSCLHIDPVMRPTMTVVSRQLLMTYLAVMKSPYPLAKPTAARVTSHALNNCALSEVELGDFTAASGYWNQARTLRPSCPSLMRNQLTARWRSGELRPENVRQAVQTGVLRGELVAGVAGVFLQDVRREGGFMLEPPQPQSQSQPRDVDSSAVGDRNARLETRCAPSGGLDLLAVTHVQALDGGKELLLVSASRHVEVVINASGRQTVRPVRENTQLISSGDLLHWNHSEGAMDVNIHVKNSEVRPLLCIGDTISFVEGELVVDRVLDVDAAAPADSSEDREGTGQGHIQFAVLCEGHSVALPGDQYTYFDVLDTKSDAGDDDEEERKRAADLSGGEELDQDDQVDASVARTLLHFVVFGTVVGGRTQVHCGRLGQGLYKDQCPRKVRLLGRSEAIISGSNGLLGLVTVKDGRSLDRTDFLHLNYDKLVADEFVSPHPASSFITAVDTSKSNTRQTRLIVSGDDAGNVCMWGVSGRKAAVTAGETDALLASVCVDSRVVSLCMGGESTAVVGTTQRLLLLELERHGGRHNLYVRSVLDDASGRALYAVAFGEQAISIWRVLRRSAEDLAVSMWRHPNVEHPEFNQKCAYR